MPGQGEGVQPSFRAVLVIPRRPVSLGDMEILTTERRTQERWLNLFLRTWRHAGRTGQWLFASRRADPPLPASGVDAVIIVPVLRTPGRPPRLVVLKEFRVPVGDYVYAFPAGLLEEGETVEDVARRELREETGLDVVAVERVSPTLYSSAGLTDESQVIAFVTAEERGGRATPDHAEDIEVQLLEYPQVRDLARSGVRFDAKTWAVLYHFELRGNLG
jgi:ADP-ribose pyrophosphatase